MIGEENMSEMTELTKVGIKKKIAPLTSKPQAAIEETKEKTEVSHLASAQKIREVEIEMEKINHAFALVEQIREKVKEAYNKLEE